MRSTGSRRSSRRRPTVVRDGRRARPPSSELVTGDLVRLKPGDQVVADGRLSEAEGLGIDASVLTGEPEPVAVDVGDAVRSGSFAVEGAGAYLVEAAGPDSYAERLAGMARTFRHPRSPLERAVNQLLLWLVGLMLVLGAILGYSLWRREAGLTDAVSTATAAVLSMVPEGLVLLVSLTYAVASLRMARRGALAQQLNAIESLAAVDVICTDKTGTLTEAALRVVERRARPLARARHADRRAWPLRREHAGAQHHARGDRRGVPGRARAGGPARAVLVAATLERARAGGRDARARSAGAL